MPQIISGDVMFMIFFINFIIHVLYVHVRTIACIDEYLIMKCLIPDGDHHQTS